MWQNGRKSWRTSIIGILKCGKDTMTGVIDIAMISSLYKKGRLHEKLNSYGMVIMDECHHAASTTAQEILKSVNAKYVYGVSATPMRSDNLEKINYMLLGTVRHKYTALERTAEQGIKHLVYPRYTRVIKTSEALDVRECVVKGRTPVILTKYKEHAKFLYDNLQGSADYIFICMEIIQIKRMRW